MKISLKNDQLLILSMAIVLPAEATEIISGSFDAREMKIHLKVSESTTGNKYYGLVGGCFMNVQPTQCVFTPNPGVLSNLTAPETNEFTININDLRISGRNRLGLLGSTFLEPSMADRVPESKINPKASLRNLFGGENAVVVRILGDNNTEFSTVLPNGFGKPTE